MKDDERPYDWHYMPDYWVQGGTKAKSAESGGAGVVIYSYEDGSKVRVTAYSLPSVRNNNPGNIHVEVKGLSKDGRDKLVRHAREKFGALDIDKDGYYIFPDWLTGLRAADSVWEDMRRDSKTIDGAAKQFLSGDKPANIEKRKKDLVSKARGYVDKHGRPVDRYTHLSDLTDEQFAALRYYNNIQLEGWLGNVDEAKIEWIPPSGATRQGPAATQKAPASKTPVPYVPTSPHSSLKAPQPPAHASSFRMGTPDQTEPMAQENKLLSYEQSQRFPMPPADPLAHYGGGRLPSSFSPPMKNPSVPWLDALVRPNLLSSPPELDFFSAGKANPPQSDAHPSGQARGSVRPAQEGPLLFVEG